MKLKIFMVGAVAAVALTGTAMAQPQGMGPGMMGGHGGGYGMGQGMMGGGYAMGSGMGSSMMFGCTNDAYAGLELTPEQQKTIAGIHEQTSKTMWQHMGTMHGQGNHMQGMFGSGPVDEAAARKSFQTMSETQKAMFELQLDTRKKIDAILTKDQREKLIRYGSRR